MAFRRTRSPGLSSYDPGDSARGSLLARALRRSFNLSILSGLTEAGIIATIARQVPGASSAGAGDVSRSASLAGLARVSFPGTAAAGDATRSGQLAAIARQAPDFPGVLIDEAAQALIATIARQVPGASGWIAGDIEQAAQLARRQVQAFVGAYLAGDIEQAGLIYQQARQVPGFAAPFLGIPIVPIDELTLRIRPRSWVIHPGLKRSTIRLNQKGFNMSVPARKVEEVLFEREQTTAASMPWTFDFTDRLGELGAASIDSLVVTCDEGNTPDPITIANETITALKASAQLGPATGEGDYHIRYKITFDTAPYTEEAVLLLHIRDVPQN